MSKFGWSLPPGVTTSMLPGNTPEDEAAEAQAEAIVKAMADAGFSEEIMNSREMDQAIDNIMGLLSTAYAQGHKDGLHDEAQYRDWKESERDPS